MFIVIGYESVPHSFRCAMLPNINLTTIRNFAATLSRVLTVKHR